MEIQTLNTKMQKFNSQQYRQFFYYDVCGKINELIKISLEYYVKTEDEKYKDVADQFEEELKTFQERYSDYRNSGLVFNEN